MTGTFRHVRSSTRRVLITSMILAAAFQGCRPDNPAEHAVSVDEAWTRPYNAEAGISTAVYLTIHNKTTTTAELVGAYIAQSDTVEIHQSIQEKGMMRMRPAQSVLIEAQESLAFKPGGHHMMVKGLQRSLALGDSLEITLGFADGQTVKTVARTMWEHE